MTRQARITRAGRRIAITLCCLLALTLLTPFAFAEAGRKTVRVGWHEAPFFVTDQYGRRSGYSYEYQWKVAAYTGWDYEYVEGTWSELLQMLRDGKLDVMSDVSYMEERAQSMLFPTLPMGTEAYYIFVSPDNTEITADDYASLAGKRIGVTDTSIQKDLFLQWAQQHGVEAELISTTTPEEESLKRLADGTLDAFVTIDIYGDPETAVPVCKIGSSDFYFAVNKDRPDLLVELNAAMNRIQDENKYYNQQLHEKYLGSFNTDRYLSSREKAWLSDHDTIRVGYQDGYLAFCATDPETGELTGALKDYLAYASTCLEDAHLNFEAVSYPTASAAIEAMKRGDVDCVFPANLTDCDSEALDVVMSPPLMRTEMDAVVRASEQKEFVRKQDVVVAVNQGNTNYDMWLSDNYPTWRRAYFADTPTGLQAVAAGGADCVIISNYRFSNISRQCEKLHLTTVYTGVDMDYCFALRKGDIDLYSILSRAIKAVPDAVVHTALTYYSTEDVKTSFSDLIKDNLFIVMAVIAGVLLVILLLLLHSIHAERKVLEEEKLVKDLNRRAYVDALTSVRNKGAFANYTQEMQTRLEQGEKFDFAIGVFDCDNLKQMNDVNGHDKGDVYIKAACRLICRVFQHSPVFRIGGDEFAVVLQNDDFRNREALVERFEREKAEISAAAENEWEEPRVAIGIAVYDPETDGSISDTMRRADRNMYENKRVGKAAK
ncbi:MAG: transporter substrate-binding domain-containing protein [Clostridia bacterium]|nr:transporter substrate-binding domain-containing protein [Clostridia bacterium]